MINKITIENQWKNNPNKLYFVIQNPKINKTTKAVSGLPIKTVAYKIRDWNSSEIYFERVDKTKDLRFPEIITLDKKYHDASNEVFHERKNNPLVIESYAIFEDQNQAYFNKLMRLHRFSENISALYEAQAKSNTNEITITVEDSYGIKAMNNNVDKKPVKLTGKELEKIFDLVQNTNYYDKLEEHQNNHPDLAIM